MFDPPFPTRLKLDVDGIEMQILEGAQKTLRDQRLRSVMVELSVVDELERDRAIARLSDSGIRVSFPRCNTGERAGKRRKLFLRSKPSAELIGG